MTVLLTFIDSRFSTLILNTRQSLLLLASIFLNCLSKHLTFLKLFIYFVVANILTDFTMRGFIT